MNPLNGVTGMKKSTKGKKSMMESRDMALKLLPQKSTNYMMVSIQTTQELSHPKTLMTGLTKSTNQQTLRRSDGATTDLISFYQLRLLI